MRERKEIQKVLREIVFCAKSKFQISGTFMRFSCLVSNNRMGTKFSLFLSCASS